jgi:hypothetical protein
VRQTIPGIQIEIIFFKFALMNLEASEWAVKTFTLNFCRRARRRVRFDKIFASFRVGELVEPIEWKRKSQSGLRTKRFGYSSSLLIAPQQYEVIHVVSIHPKEIAQCRRDRALPCLYINLSFNSLPPIYRA